jgi:hypothetical protein
MFKMYRSFINCKVQKRGKMGDFNPKKKLKQNKNTEKLNKKAILLSIS